LCEPIPLTRLDIMIESKYELLLDRCVANETSDKTMKI
jgi:hypothetical protein